MIYIILIVKIKILSYQNIFEPKKANPNYIKIRNIDYKSYNNKSNINKNIIKVNKFIIEKEEKNVIIINII